MNGNLETRMTRRRALTVAATGGALALAPVSWRARTISAQQAATPRPDSDLDALVPEFEEFVVARMSELGVPGLAVGIIASDAEYTAGFGVTNLDHPLPVDAETLFQIGSTTKTMTATALMRLVEQGKIDLESPVRDYLPQFRVADSSVSEQVLVRHLLSHTAGWFGDDFTDPGNGDDALVTYVAEMADLPQIAPLGEYFSYNNAAFVVAGRVIEKVTSQTYEEAVKDLVLTPLGMEHSYFFPEEVMTHAFAVGHVAPPDRADGAPQVVPEWALPRAVNPAGGLTSSVTDQLCYVRFHLGHGEAGGGDMLSSESLEAMQSPTGPGGAHGPYVLDGVGVSWLLTTIGGERAVMHGGSTNGQQSSFMLLPDLGFGMTVLTNADVGALLAEEAVLWVLERLYDLTLSVPAALEVSAEDLAEYAGQYSVGEGIVLAIAEENGILNLEATQDDQPIPDGTGPLVVVGPDLTLFDFGGMSMMTDFVRDDAGEVKWIRFSGRMLPKVNR